MRQSKSSHTHNLLLIQLNYTGQQELNLPIELCDVCLYSFKKYVYCENVWKEDTYSFYHLFNNI